MVSMSSSSQMATTAAATVFVVISTAAAWRYQKYCQSHRKGQLGTFPHSSSVYLPFLDLIRFIRAGTFESFFKERQKALQCDTFYIYLLGVHKGATLVLLSPTDHAELIRKDTGNRLNLIVDMPDGVYETHGPGSLQHISGERHNRLRKMFSSLLSPKITEGFIPHFIEAFTAMWKELENSSDKAKPIQDAICKTQFFLMAKILYGMIPDENTPMDVMTQLGEDFEAQLVSHFASPTSVQFQKGKAAAKRIRKILSAKFDAVLAVRRNLYHAKDLGGQEKKKNDDDNGPNENGDNSTTSSIGNAMESIADALLQDGSDRNPQMLLDVYDNLNLLLEASHGTTMTVTTTILYYLNHPDNDAVLSKLRAEIKSLVVTGAESSNSPPSLSTLKNDMPITEGCIKEAMRLAPIIGMVTFKVNNNNTFTFKGQTLQGPMSFMLGFAHNYKNDKLFPNPDAFIPERWIPNSPEAVSPEARLAYKPFGLGKHMCLGFQLAMLIMKSSLYCFASDETRSIEFDNEAVGIKSGIFPAYFVSDGFPGKTVSKS